MKTSPTFPLPRSQRTGRLGFTLMELLIVLTIIGIFFAMTAPQITGVLGSNRISSSGELIYNKLAQAQQKAITENREILVRFFEYESADAPTPDKEFRAIQFIGRDADGAVEALSDVLPLTQGTKISRDSKLSTLVTDSALASGSAEIPQTETSESYLSFAFYPDGSTSLPSKGTTDDNWFLTVVSDKPSSTDIPKNFYCVQIDPVTGRLKAYRP
jgi:uncharacterized protein (TIGR02596 family)